MTKSTGIVLGLIDRLLGQKDLHHQELISHERDSMSLRQEYNTLKSTHNELLTKRNGREDSIRISKLKIWNDMFSQVNQYDWLRDTPLTDAVEAMRVNLQETKVSFIELKEQENQAIDHLVRLINSARQTPTSASAILNLAQLCEEYQVLPGKDLLCLLIVKLQLHLQDNIAARNAQHKHDLEFFGRDWGIKYAEQVNLVADLRKSISYIDEQIRTLAISDISKFPFGSIEDTVDGFIKDYRRIDGTIWRSEKRKLEGELEAVQDACENYINASFDNDQQWYNLARHINIDVKTLGDGGQQQDRDIDVVKSELQDTVLCLYQDTQRYNEFKAAYNLWLKYLLVEVMGFDNNTYIAIDDKLRREWLNTNITSLLADVKRLDNNRQTLDRWVEGIAKQILEIDVMPPNQHFRDKIYSSIQEIYSQNQHLTTEMAKVSEQAAEYRKAALEAKQAHDYLDTLKVIRSYQDTVEQTEAGEVTEDTPLRLTDRISAYKQVVEPENEVILVELTELAISLGIKSSPDTLDLIRQMQAKVNQGLLIYKELPVVIQDGRAHIPGHIEVSTEGEEKAYKPVKRKY